MHLTWTEEQKFKEIHAKRFNHQNIFILGQQKLYSKKDTLIFFLSKFSIIARWLNFGWLALKLIRHTLDILRFLDILTKDNLTRSTIWRNRFDEKYNLAKNYLGKVQFQIFCQIVLRQKYFVKLYFSSYFFYLIVLFANFVRHQIWIHQIVLRRNRDNH